MDATPLSDSTVPATTPIANMPKYNNAAGKWNGFFSVVPAIGKCRSISWVLCMPT